MPTTSNTFTNALLADATYVHSLTAGLSADPLKTKLSERMTPTLAAYISSNFSVLTQIESGDTLLPGFSGFDATVWRQTDGKLFVSMRGTEPGQDLFITDADLAVTGNASAQIVDMVNWWLRETGAAGASVRQIGYNLPGPGVSNFYEAAASSGTGRITAANLVNGIEVNGHSLGGYLAAAFTRVFGSQAHVQHTSTFNSAGFAPGSEAVFTELQNLIGLSYGLGRFPNASEQTNYFAQNGLNLTTNNTWFTQTGNRVELFNESDVTQVGNHFMYKLTDALALGNALVKLDGTLGTDIDGAPSTSKLNALFAAGSNNTHASIEGVFDGLLRVLQGNGVAPTPIGDASDSAGSRLAYHANLKTLTDSATFQSLAGKVTLSLPIDASLVITAKTEFGAAVSLTTLSPFTLKANSPEGQTALEALWQTPAWSNTYQSWLSDYAARQGGGVAVNFTDTYLYDRQALLQNIITANVKDGVVNPDGYLAVQGTPSGSTNTRYIDTTSGTLLQTNTARISPSTAPNKYVIFGDSAANTINGSAQDDRLYGGAGADILNGQGGNDYEEGGTGFDTFQFDAGFGNDTILDSDGQGAIRIGATTLSGGKKLSDNLWESDDKTIIFLQQGADLLIGQRAVAGASTVAGTITVKNWSSGQLGITLNNTVVPAAANTSGTPSPILVYLTNPIDPGTVHFNTNAVPDVTTFGALSYTDLNPVDHWVWAKYDGGQTITLGDGNDYVDVGREFGDGNGHSWTAVPGEDEDVVSTGGGNDTIRTGYGSDTISAGAGNDIIYSARVEAGQYHGAADALSGDLVDGGDGNDDVWGSMGADILFGGAGDDGMSGLEGNDVLVGGDGNDYLNGDSFYVSTVAQFEYYVGSLLGYTSGGDDTLFGGAGNDRLIGGVGKDYLDGGTGDDQLFGDTDSYYVAGNAAWIPGEFHGDDTLDGGDGNDFLVGGGGSDVLLGGAGNDTIYGDQYDSPEAPGLSMITLQYEGNDYLEGGSGTDRLYGGGGDDFLGGGDDQDYLYGGLGDDTLMGGDDTDYLYGEAGNDVLIGGSGIKNTLIGGDGDDLIVVGGTNDVVDGGAGRDTIQIEEGATFSITGAPKTTAAAALGMDDADSLVLLKDGSASTSFLEILGDLRSAQLIVWGSYTTVTIKAPTGVALGDVLSAITFGDGSSWNQAQIKAQLRGVATEGDDKLFALDDESSTRYGLGGNDYMFGGNGNNVFYGGDGSDHLFGGAGDDTFDGGAGFDEMHGWGGSNTYLFGRGSGQDFIYNNEGGTVDNSPDTIKLGAGIATTDVTIIRPFGSNSLRISINGTSEYVFVGGYFSAAGVSSFAVQTIKFADGTTWDTATVSAMVLQATAGADQLTGYDAGETINGGEGGDRINGMGGDDFLQGGAGYDYVEGGDGNDTLLGNEDNDSLSGGNGNDIVQGGSGDDQLSGDDGNDTLEGGTGNDTLRGGNGVDTYIFERGWGQDYVNSAEDNPAGLDADVFVFGGGIAPTDLILAHGPGNFRDSLYINLKDSTDSILNP